MAVPRREDQGIVLRGAEDHAWRCKLTLLGGRCANRATSADLSDNDQDEAYWLLFLVVLMLKHEAGTLTRKEFISGTASECQSTTGESLKSKEAAWELARGIDFSAGISDPWGKTDRHKPRKEVK